MAPASTESIENVNGFCVLLKPTSLSAVRQSYSVSVVDDGDGEDGFHGWLIEARESFPGVRRLHLRGSDNSAKYHIYVFTRERHRFSDTYIQSPTKRNSVTMETIIVKSRMTECLPLRERLHCIQARSYSRGRIENAQHFLLYALHLSNYIL